MSDEAKVIEAWAILELMGHVRLAGRVSEEEKFGTKLGRIDVPQKDGTFVTQYFSGSSIYRLTPVSEHVARDAAGRCQPQPVQPWEYPKQLPTAEAARPGSGAYLGDEDEDDRDDWRGEL